MAIIGYARVSTSHQNEAPQVEELTAAGCTVVYSEKISTRKDYEDRPQLQAALAALVAGDTLMVPKLDRLGRTQAEVIACLHRLQTTGVHVKTLDGLIDTQALGKMAPLIIGLLTGLAEVERELIRERTLASIEWRRREGKSLGGRPRTYTGDQADLVRDLRAAGDSLRKVASKTGLPLATVQRILNN